MPTATAPAPSTTPQGQRRRVGALPRRSHGTADEMGNMIVPGVFARTLRTRCPKDVSLARLASTRGPRG